MTTPGPRVAAYCRQSKAREGERPDTSLSLDAQEAQIRGYAERHGLALVAVVRDHDELGADPGRPGLAELTALVEAGRIDRILVAKWDRLARDVWLQESLVRGFARRGVTVQSITEASDKIARVLYGAFAEVWRDQHSERIAAVRRAQAQRGQHIGSHAPYGFRRAGTRLATLPDGTVAERPSGPLVPDPREAPVLIELYERVDAGEPLFAIAGDLARRLAPTKRGGPWTVTTIRRILRNPASCGDVVYHGTVVARDAHPAIVSRALWERVNARLDREAPIRRQSPHALASWCEGLVEHACGRRLYLVPIQGKPRRDGSRVIYPNFACRLLYEATRCGVRPAMISARRLEDAVRLCLAADLAGRLALPEAIACAREAAGGRDVERARRALEERRRRAERRHHRARERWLAGREPLAWMDEEDERYAAELAAIAAELAALPALPDPGQYAAAAARLDALAAALAAASHDALRALLVETGVAVVGPDGVTLRWRPPYREFIPAPARIVPG